jgi:HEAT repeat protein
MRKAFRVLAVTVVGACLAGAPAWAETITNEDVIKMVKSGLSEKLVIKKITTSKCRFDVSAEKLIELKEAEVPEAVINLMLDIHQERLTSIKGAVQVSLQGFKDPEGKQGERSLRDLRRLGPDAIPELVKQGLINEHEGVRAGSVEAIGMIGHADGLEPVTDALVDRAQVVREAAARALRYLVTDADRERVTKRLSAMLTDIEKPSDGAVLALGQLGVKEALPDLRRAAQGDTSPRMRAVAVEAIGQMRDAESLELLITRLLEDRSSQVRIAAGISLARIGDAKAVLPLVKAFERYPQDRRHFVGPMAKFHEKKIVETLIEALEDDDSRVGELAWEGLRLLTGERMKKDRSIWAEWWELDGEKRF